MVWDLRLVDIFHSSAITYSSIAKMSRISRIGSESDMNKSIEKVDMTEGLQLSVPTFCHPELLHSSAICSLKDCCRKKKKNMTSLEPQKSLCFKKKLVIASSFQLRRNPKKTNLSCDNPAIRRLHPHPPIPGAPLPKP